jgi:hypothetical protein
VAVLLGNSSHNLPSSWRSLGTIGGNLSFHVIQDMMFVPRVIHGVLSATVGGLCGTLDLWRHAEQSSHGFARTIRDKRYPHAG